MKKWPIYIIFLFLFCFSLKVEAQSNRFFKSYNVYANAYGSVVQQTNDGGFVVSAANIDTMFLNPLDSTQYSIVEVVSVIKTFSDGNLEWIKNYFTGTDCAYGGGFTKTMDGGYVYSTVVYDPTTGWPDILLFKVNSAGIPLWSKKYGGDGNEYAFSVIETTNGELVISGYTNSHNTGYGDMYIIKTNANGNLIWANTYDYGNTDDYSYSIIQTQDGGFATTAMIMGDTTYDMAVLKLNSQGDIQFFKKYPLSASEYIQPYKIKETPDNFLLVTGDYYNDVTGMGLLMKISANGNFIWTKRYAKQLDYYNYFLTYDLVVNNQNEYLLLGAGTSYDSITYESNSNFGILKTNNNGDFISYRSISTEFQGMPNCLNYADDGDLLITGFDYYNYSSFIVKTDGKTNFTCDEFSMDLTTYPLYTTGIPGGFKDSIPIVTPTTITYNSLNGVTSEFCELKNQCDIEIEVPNVFTPNEDDYNDEFYFTEMTNLVYECKIYNRWGTLVATLTEENGFWNGKHDSNDASEGVYYYVAEIECGEDGKKVNGMITLLR